MKVADIYAYATTAYL